ncbi:MAG: hypothetical protein CMI54_05735 [Parcubacteria group bacterium]|nr:hypothetical protein [Parcubacteria group bacterium]|tara:strand:+ start:445 stop:747 length:303 start_codon:yes stop_codon:yes gene_type:complete
MIFFATVKHSFQPDDEYDSDDMKNVPQYAIERFSTQVEEILNIFEVPQVFVSDRTTVGDFNLTLSELDSYNHKFKSQYGIEINQDKLIWEIAEEIYESQF